MRLNRKCWQIDRQVLNLYILLNVIKFFSRVKFSTGITAYSMSNRGITRVCGTYGIKPKWCPFFSWHGFGKKLTPWKLAQWKMTMQNLLHMNTQKGWSYTVIIQILNALQGKSKNYFSEVILRLYTISRGRSLRDMVL